MQSLDARTDLIGGHLAAEKPIQRRGNSIAGTIVSVTYSDKEITIGVIEYGEEEVSAKSPRISLDTCTWRSEVYLQCEAGNIGCIVIDDHRNMRTITIHGVRLSS